MGRGIGILAAAVSLALAPAGAAEPPRQPLATAEVVADSAGAQSYEGVVEAVRQSDLAAQVAGTVLAIDVKPGDRVSVGQVLVRIDARASEQGAAASEAQVQAARAALDAAAQEVERQRQLFARAYISQAALDRAEAQYRAAKAQSDAQIAQAEAARTQSGFFTLRAPYDAMIAQVPATVGDMAMPGRTLLSLYDASRLRVTAMIPQSDVSAASLASARVEIPALGSSIEVRGVQVLPTADPQTHTREVRLPIVRGQALLAPGVFARVWLRAATAGAAGALRLFVPASAIVQRAELSAVYVVGPQGQPLLRQVRLGQRSQDRVEVLAGLSAGERVALDPRAASVRR
jgi:membrane fusion protein, multidrug efflux system